MRIITDVDQLKEACSGVSVLLSLESLTSFIDDVETRVVLMIGEPALANVLGHPLAYGVLRRVVVNLALDGYASTGAIQISDSGIHVSKSEKLLPASDKKLLAFRRDAKERGWSAFEQLVSVMEGNKPVFTGWHGSEYRKAYLNCLFHSSTEFSSFAGISISADLFQVIKARIAFVEEDVLERDFGDLVESIRSGLLAGNLEVKYKKLLRYFLRVLGPLSVADAIPYRLVEVSESGVYQSSVSTFGTASDNVEGKSIPQQRILMNVLMKLETEGESNLVKAKKWLNDNKSEFPEWGQKDVYPVQSINDGDLNIYVG